MLRGRTRQRPFRLFQRTEANPNMSEIARREAEEKARDLLRSHLTPFQRFTYDHFGYFYTRGSDGIIYGLSGGERVTPMNSTGEAGESRGIHAINYFELPIPDTLLGQKLLLETNAGWVDRVACRAGYGHVPSIKKTVARMEGYETVAPLLIEEARTYLNHSWWDRLRAFISDALP